jgi:hypothetical protein
MADFLLLPPRPTVGEELARVVRMYLPGVRVTASDCVRFLDRLVERSNGGTIVVHREDLPDGEDVVASLRDAFGAETGDRLIQVSAGPNPRTVVRGLSDGAFL